MARSMAALIRAPVALVVHSRTAFARSDDKYGRRKIRSKFAFLAASLAAMLSLSQRIKMMGAGRP